METVQSYFGIRLPKINGRKTKSNIPVGIEVELEYVEILNYIENWKTERDGSLKINGAEFTIPVYNNQVKQYLTYLFDRIKAKNTSRCSIHVHVNILDFNIEQIKTLILLYSIFENTLYRYSGKRWDSNFCVPVQSHFFSTIDVINIFENARNYFPKYSGLHIIPEAKYGTAEFRHMSGNMNIDFIDSWVQIVSKLVTAASSMPLEVLKNRIKTMHTDSAYWDLAKQVFDEYYYILNNNNFKNDVETGILYSKSILCSE